MAVGQTTAKHAGPATDVSIVSIRRSTKLIDGGGTPPEQTGSGRRTAAARPHSVHKRGESVILDGDLVLVNDPVSRR